jgi:signal transduction histidine kinase
VSSALTIVQAIQLVAFGGAALAAAVMWWRRRGRPPALLALAFGSIAVSVVLLRAVPEMQGPIAAVTSDVGVIVLSCFPWLLAAFAWSFEPRLPRWLLAAGAATVGLWLWVLVLPPLPAAGAGGTQQAFVLTFIALWAGLSFAAAFRLWSSGGAQPLVRARMRVLASAAVLLALSLVLTGAAGGPPDSPVRLVASSATIVAAVLFIAGFAPPRALRASWRRRITADRTRMQLELIAAVTPQDVAAAVTPRVAATLGGYAAVVAHDGAVLATDGFDAEEITRIADRLRAGEGTGPGERAIPVDHAWLVIRTSPYAPLLGAEEEDLLTSFGLQLRLALERAELYEANERARHELQRTSDDLQATLAGLAHDLQSPSSTLSGYAMLLADVDDDRERQEMLDAIGSSAGYLQQLVDALVSLARAGRLQAEPDDVHLDVLVRDAVARLQRPAPDVRFEVGPLPTVRADRLGMQQVIDNLLGNAVKHGGRDDLTVRVDARVTPSSVELHVVDDGRGVPEEERELVFSPFRRGRSAGAAGYGVGLGLVRRIVDAHDGEVAFLPVESGAHVRLVLPR